MRLHRPHYGCCYSTESENPRCIGGIEDFREDERGKEDAGSPDGALDEGTELDVHCVDNGRSWLRSVMSDQIMKFEEHRNPRETERERSGFERSGMKIGYSRVAAGLTG